MFSHVLSGMKSFVVVLAVIIILNLTVIVVSEQVVITYHHASSNEANANANGEEPANGEHGSKCDEGDCHGSLECLSSRCDCNPKKRLVWSPTKLSCKMMSGKPIDANSACKDSGDCTDYADCVKQSAYFCWGGCQRPVYHDQRPIYIIQSGGGGNGGGGSDAAPREGQPPPSGPQECHCKHGPGSTDGTCAGSGALAGKNILPYSITMLGIGLTTMISGKILC